MVRSEDACRRLAQALLDPVSGYKRAFGNDDILVTSDSFDLINDYGTITTAPIM